MDLSQFKNKFVEDTLDLLQNMEIDLLNLEKDAENVELINQVFRAMHTIKGVASMYGFEQVSVITHHLENIFDLIRENELTINQEIIDLSFQTSDLIKLLFEDENLEQENTKNSYNILIEKIDKISNVKTKEKPNLPVNNQTIVTKKNVSTYNILFYPNDNLFKRNINIVRTFNDLFHLGDYYIYKPKVTPDNEYWSFFLVTEKSIEDIEDALFFILEDCIIKQIANYDVFDENNLYLADEELKNTIENISIEHNKRNEKLENEKQEIVKKVESKKTEIKPAKGDYNPDISIDFSKNKTKRITIDSSKLDTLMYLVSELITTNSQLVLSTKSTKYDEIRQYLEKIDSLSKNFRNNALDIRLVPLNDLVIRFKRLIRDISNNLGKNIDFETQGTETELDKSTIDLLAEPIMHLIRNGIDHGIESPEERMAKGKKPTGIIKLTAYNSGNYIFIQIQDDGRGIDVEKIKKKAIEKGLITTTDKDFTKKEILDIIFLPGFSTAQNLTQVSGRGVGMDVVRKKIAEVRGEISIDTELGLGTSFTIKLSQSIAILDTMLIECENHYFMIPIADVLICERVEREKIVNPNSSKTIPYNNDLIPFIDLREIFELSTEYPEKIKTVILKRQDKYLALITDRIIGAHQAVLKSLGHSFKEHQLISSGSLLGDGNIAYLLDTMELFKKKKK